jgi:hypothetical protein
LLYLLLLLLPAAGCMSSRWAMSDPDYAAKYGKPYGDDKVYRMAKQMVDARHVAGKSGTYCGGAFAGSPFTIGGQYGYFGYYDPWISTYGSLTAMTGTGQPDLYFGLNSGVRVEAPSRFSPFAGAGMFVGANWHTIYTVSRYLLHDSDDESGEESEDEYYEVVDKDFMPRALAAVYPEIGAHFWLDGRTRLTASGSYYFTSAGRADDFWFIGLSVGILRP